MTRPLPFVACALVAGCFVPSGDDSSSGDTSGELKDSPITLTWSVSETDAGCLDLVITTEETVDDWAMLIQLSGSPDALLSSTGVQADLDKSELFVEPEENGFLSAEGNVTASVCLSPRAVPTDLQADVVPSAAGTFGTLRDVDEVLGLVYEAGAGGCLDLEVVNLTGTPIEGWQVLVKLDQPAVLTDASGDGLRTFAGDALDELLLLPTASTNELDAFDSARGQACLTPTSLPQSITTDWDVGP